MDIHKILGVIIKPFRRKRMLAFLQRMRPNINSPILDVGGAEYNWELINYSGSVILLNIREPKQKSDRFNYVIGDATNLKYPDADFDLVYSNSVIEHLSSYVNQKKFSEEMRRVGKSIWCQTPAKEFFIEPHYITPFIHWLPKRRQKKIIA